MSYTSGLKHKQRRPSTQYFKTSTEIAATGFALGIIEPGELVGQREAIERVNAHIAKENERIARLIGESQHIQAVAADELERVYGELEALRAENAGLKRRVSELEAEVRKARKRVKPKKRFEELEGE